MLLPDNTLKTYVQYVRTIDAETFGRFKHPSPKSKQLDNTRWPVSTAPVWSLTQASARTSRIQVTPNLSLSIP